MTDVELTKEEQEAIDKAAAKAALQAELNAAAQRAQEEFEKNTQKPTPKPKAPAPKLASIESEDRERLSRMEDDQFRKTLNQQAIDLNQQSTGLTRTEQKTIDNAAIKAANAVIKDSKKQGKAQPQPQPQPQARPTSTNNTATVTQATQPKPAATTQKSVETTKSVQQTGQQVGESSVSDAESLMQEGIQDYAKAINSEYTDFATLVQGMKDDYDRSIKEDQARLEAERRNNRYAGITQLASSLVNLVGVANGASNQPQHNFSQSWMQEADKERQARQTRIDNIRERQRAYETQLNALKTSGMKSLAEMKLKSANAMINANDKAQRNAISLQKAEWSKELDAEKLKLSKYKAQLQAERNADNRKRIEQNVKESEARVTRIQSNIDAMNAILNNNNPAASPAETPATGETPATAGSSAPTAQTPATQKKSLFDGI